MEQILTFEKLPEAVAFLIKEVSEIKRLLTEKLEAPFPELHEQVLDIHEAAKFLNLTVPTIYSKVSKRELPYMKRSKRLYFSPTELLEYVKEGRRKTTDEIEQEAKGFVYNRIKNKNR